jgi:hypothetical protein
MTDTLTISPFANGQESTEHVRVTETTSQVEGERLIPFSVPRGQLYYWTRRWQVDEREALKELDAGLGREFSDGKSAAEWLLTDDED